MNGGWGKGSGACGNNCNGAVDLNSSGGFKVPGSRYQNEILVSGNQFVNNWEGVDIWQPAPAPVRTPAKAGRTTPRTARAASRTARPRPRAGSTTSPTRGTAPTAGLPPWRSRPPREARRSWSAGALPSTTRSASRIPDRPRPPTTRASIPSPARGPSTPRPPASRLRASFASGRRRPGPTAAEVPGAILSYRGTTPSSFTGVSRSEAPGRWPAPIREVQPYKVTAEKCFANNCAVTVSPPLAAPQSAGAAVSNAGTCQLYATSSALPSGPLAPDGTSYWDGCQWEAKNISVTGNVFQFDPSVIASSAPLAGGGKTTTCTAAHSGRMRDQLHGVPGIAGRRRSVRRSARTR